MDFLSNGFTSEMAMTILESSDQFVGALDVEGKIIYANQTALSFIGAQLTDVAGLCFWDTPWWNFDAQLQQELRDVIESTRISLKSQGMQVQHRSAQGNTHYFYFTLKPLLSNERTLLGFIAEGKDINDLVSAQERIRSEILRYRDLFANSSDAHLIIEGSVFVEANDMAVEALGYASEADLIDVHPSSISPVEQPDGRLSSEKADDMIAIAYKNGSHRFEWVHLRKDGTPIDVEVVLTPIRSGSKNLLYVTWRDISERIQAQKALIHKQQLLANLMIGISHELATPLGNSITATSYLKDVLIEKNINPNCSQTIQDEIDALLVIERNLNTTVSLLEYFKNHAMGIHTEDDEKKPLHNLTKNALNHK